MGKIHLLSPDIISKIAAGEVIERPASAIKELLENSLDALSSDIEIHLKDAGKTLIHIKDNGSGIESDDIEKIFLRHSTSKIKNLEDIYQINSLGFRGEALYSISAISDIILRSKTSASQHGWGIHTRAGEKLSLKPANIPQGTHIEIRELFFNTPARRKFLKPDPVELQKILDICIPYFLFHYQKRFLFTHNQKNIIDLSPSKNYLERVKNLFNLETKHLIELKHNFLNQKVSLYMILGDINIQRANKGLQFIFINNRPVENKNISFQINQAYRLIFPAKLYPFFAIYIDLPAQDLDVNIHPTKRQVKIKNEAWLGLELRNLCTEALMSKGKAKQIKTSPFQISTPLAPKSPASKIYYPITKEGQLPIGEPQVKEEIGLPLPQKKSEDTGQQTKVENLKTTLSQAHYVGNFLNKYLIFETAASLLFIDQHAAAERITYERLKKQFEAFTIETQTLLTPIIIPLNTQEMLVWEKGNEVLEKIGFSTTRFDKTNIALHTHPQLIGKAEIALRNLLAEEETLSYDPEKLARAACRSSIMAGDSTTIQEAEYLRKHLIKCSDPFTCPHGRPTTIEITENILKKQFLR